MEPFTIDMWQAVRENELFRSVLFTGEHAQVVAMTLQPGERIGEEVHEVDQLFVLIEGLAAVEVDGARSVLGPGAVLFVPAGSLHDIGATGAGGLRLLTIYAPPQHAPGTVHRTRGEALAAEELEHAMA
jgi:mannose-6-phosphate isomerase-like protein (cupin superfamily)